MKRRSLSFLAKDERRLDPLQEAAKLSWLSAFGEFPRQKRDRAETVAVTPFPDPSTVRVEFFSDGLRELLERPNTDFMLQSMVAFYMSGPDAL